jgi:DNA-binding MarR family transcriptional regulator
MKIEEFLQQKKFESEFHKLQLNILYTASWLHQETNHLLKPFDLTGEQFNVLRILRGARPEKVSLKYIAERMINRQSNTSRLVDKLFEKKWIERVVCPQDRRQVELYINTVGLKILEEASDKVKQMQNVISEQINLQDAIHLNKCLDQIRAKQIN